MYLIENWLFETLGSKLNWIALSVVSNWQYAVAYVVPIDDDDDDGDLFVTLMGIEQQLNHCCLNDDASNWRPNVVSMQNLTLD